jgi:D-alanyl-D-alanine carboxypeptidase (penicillin-binding protein 5/6)
VTNNALSSRQRQNGVIELLDYGFDNFETITFFDENETIAKASVWLGAKEKLELVAKGEIAVTIPLGQTSENIEFEVKYKEPLFTPIKKDQEVGKLIITIDGEAIREVRLHAKEDVDKASYFSRMWLVFKYKFGILLE